MNLGKWLCALMLLGGLSGCGGSSDVGDLDAYMNEVRARPAGTIEPTPTFQSYEAFTYNASSLRSPFQPPLKIDLVNRQKGSREVKPDLARTKQFLEGFNIEQFEMVGTLANATGTYALLRGANGVYRVKEGDYLGRDEGRIVRITDTQVDVVEIVADGEGAWLERPRTIPLKEHS